MRPTSEADGPTSSTARATLSSSLALQRHRSQQPGGDSATGFVRQQQLD